MVDRLCPHYWDTQIRLAGGKCVNIYQLQYSYCFVCLLVFISAVSSYLKQQKLLSIVVILSAAHFHRLWILTFFQI